MKNTNYLVLGLFMVMSLSMHAQINQEAKADFYGVVSSVEYVSPMSERPEDLKPADDSVKEARDKRSFASELSTGADPQKEDDYFVRNRNEKEQSARAMPPSVVFDAYASGSQPTDPSVAIGPNHVFTVFNTGFAIYDKSGGVLQSPIAPNPAIFPSGGCCDLTVSYDNAADRWVLTFLGAGAQIAVSDGPNPLTAGWYVYTISAISDYQKLSIWSDGYYITENTGSSQKVWALERDAMLAGSPSAQIVSFSLPGIVTSGFHSPQALNVTDNNMPADGGATVVYMQDDAWSGVSNDHIKVWTIDVNWASPGSSTVSAATEISTTPFIGVFDNGSFSNLRQPGGGRPIRIDALQATIMNQAQFRKFATHNSAVFNFVVDVDASSNKLAGVRWFEFRQNADNQPWSLYQEGTYTAPDNRHAWNASLAMDGQGNIGMGYTSMSSESSSSTVQVSSYFTGRVNGDPLNTMTVMEEVIANGNAKIPGTRYGDYSKIDVDPSDDQTFWFINEYMNGSRRGVVGAFQIQAGPPDTEAPSTPSNLTANAITSSGATLNWDASTDNVGVSQYNVSIDGSSVGTTSSTSFDVTGLSPLTAYSASVTAQDAAGNVSGSASTSFTTTDAGTGGGEIAAYYFETGFDGWIDGGNDCARVNSANSFEGSFSIRLRDDSSTSNAQSPILDLSGNTTVSIEFHTYANSMESGEDFFVEFFNGSSYQVIGNYASGTDFSNGSFFTDTIELSSAVYNFNANNRFRFRSNGNANNDQIFFDQVIITGDGSSSFREPLAEGTAILKNFNQSATDAISLYPNPTSTVLNIDIIDQKFDDILVYSSTGRLLQTIKPDSNNGNYSVDVSNYAAGMYFVRFVSDGQAVTKRFIKR